MKNPKIDWLRIKIIVLICQFTNWLKLIQPILKIIGTNLMIIGALVIGAKFVIWNWSISSPEAIYCVWFAGGFIALMSFNEQIRKKSDTAWVVSNAALISFWLSLTLFTIFITNRLGLGIKHPFQIIVSWPALAGSILALTDGLKNWTRYKGLMSWEKFDLWTLPNVLTHTLPKAGFTFILIGQSLLFMDYFSKSGLDSLEYMGYVLNAFGCAIWLIQICLVILIMISEDGHYTGKASVFFVDERNYLD